MILITRRLWGELVDDVLSAKEESKGSPGEKFLVCVALVVIANSFFNRFSPSSSFNSSAKSDRTDDLRILF